jgi:hypothetical protein
MIFILSCAVFGAPVVSRPLPTRKLSSGQEALPREMWITAMETERSTGARDHGFLAS